MKITIAIVRALALALPGSSEAPSYGTPGFRVKKQLFARVLDDDRIVVKMSLDHRDLVLAEEPALFALTDHYRAHPWVIVQLRAITKARLADVLHDAWREAGGSEPEPKRKRAVRR